MRDSPLRGQTSNIGFVFIQDSASTVGAGKTGLTNASAGLNIAIRREKSATFTSYTGANIGTIVTLGTYVAPGAGKVNFKECDSANAPGLYELHFDDPVFGAGDTSRKVVGMVQVTGGAPSPFEIPLLAVDSQDGVRGGMTALPNAAAGSTGGLVPGVLRGGTAQAGAANTITLDAGASATDNLYQDLICTIIGGVGAGQSRSINSYVGSTKVATVFPNWFTNPTATSVFILTPAGQVDVGNWLNTAPNPLIAGRVDASVGAMAANVITAASIAAGALNGKGDWLLSTSYTTPPTAAAIATAVWTDATAGDFTVAGSIGKSLGGAWTALGTSVYTAGALANAPTGGGATAAQIATAVWQDATAADFTVASSIGKALYINNVAPGAAGGHFISGTNAGTTTFGALTVTGAFNVGSTNLVLAKGTNITGFNDIAATAIVSAGAITTAGGAVSTVTNVTNPVTTGTISVGAITAASIAAGALNGKGDWLLSTSYVVPPTAAAIAALIVSAGPITTAAGAVVTVTNVTNPVAVGSLGAGVITAASIAAGALNGKGDWLLSTSYVVPPTAASIAALIVSAGPITTSAGAVSTVTNVTNPVAVGSLGAGVITAASIAAGALNGKGDWLKATDISTIVATFDNDIIEPGVTRIQQERIVLASQAGQTNGAPGASFNVRDTGNTKNRIAATVDANGNRTAVVLNGT